MIRLSVDIGGTFTDLALDNSGVLSVHKVLTTPDKPEMAALQGLRELLQRNGIRLEQVQSVIHGTTLATNALIERKGAKTAFVTSRGFRDVLEMRYEKRFDQYDLDIEMPAPLVPRIRRLTLAERILANGEVKLAPASKDVAAIAAQLNAQGVEAVAIGFLHSYVNHSHEQQVAEQLATLLDGRVTICLSSEVSPEAREYERFSTVCANAYVRPLMSRYLQEFHAALLADRFAGAFMLMLSGGGITTLAQAMRTPIRLVESGPAGGVALATHVARQLDSPKTLALDMGGTTAKICLLENATPQTTRRLEVARAWRDVKGSGLPLRVPSIELVEIGAGGGSIGRVDDMQRLNVGPDSAAAEPGPACYQRGGTEATVTDANLVVGRIDAEQFADGQFTLDRAAAEHALTQHITDKLNLQSNQWAAAGVLEVSEETMAHAARVHAIELGKNLAEFDLLASGGGGPLHAARIAEKLDIRRVIIPAHAGVGSAIGFLHAPVSFEQARSVLLPLSGVNSAGFEKRLAELTTAVTEVVRQAVADAVVTTQASAELRYAGQGQELRLALPGNIPYAQQLDSLDQRFRAEYKLAHGFSMQGIEVELVALSVTAQLDKTVPDSNMAQHSHDCKPSAGKALAAHTRTLFDTQSGQSIQVNAYQRDALPFQSTVAGPCLVSEAQTTTLVPAGWRLTRLQYGHLAMDRQ